MTTRSSHADSAAAAASAASAPRPAGQADAAPADRAPYADAIACAARIAAAAPTALIAWDTTGRIRFLNPGAERMFGYRADQWAQLRATDLLDLPGAGSDGGWLEGTHWVNGLRRGGVAFPAELTLTTDEVDGEQAEDGSTALYVATVRDCTREQAVMEQAREDHGLLADVLANIPCFVFWKDRQSIYRGCNENFARAAGLASSAQIVGKTDYDLPWTRQESDAYRTRDQHTMDTGLPLLNTEEAQCQSNGVLSYRLTSRVPLRDPRGKVIGLLGIYNDVSSLKQIQHELEKARLDAEAANRAKTAFLANMSHEIRTPMTAIIGFLDVVLAEGAGVASMDRAEARRIVGRNAEHLLHLVNQILDLAQVEVGEVPLSDDVIDLAALLAEVKRAKLDAASDRGLVLGMRTSGALPACIRGDRRRVQEILLNLVDNGIKFTDHGGVYVHVHADADPSSARIHFEVEDTGIGIDKRQAKMLFAAFAHDTSMSRRFGGAGLGLAINQRIATLMNGDLVLAESSPAIGSRFRFTLPLDPVQVATSGAERPQETAVDRAGLRNDLPGARLDCRVLVAEDGPDNQLLIRHMLTVAGADVTIVPDGQQAVEAALVAEGENQPFDVILMDMQMPVLDGYDATRALRERGYQRPIIALTAHAMELDQQRCLDAGCDDYEPKPVRRELLLSKIRGSLSRSA